MWIHYKITCSVVATGTSLERWKTCISCHIEKNQGSPKLHGLRVVQIYKANLNLVLKILWLRELIQHAEQHFVLGDYQCGSML